MMKLITKFYPLFLVFMTGAVTLSLEMIASKILSPYFGVSLYIWSGILSITLLSLALGYYWGSFLTRKQDLEQQHYFFLLLPAIAPFFIFTVRLIYPYLFPDLAVFNLVIGSFLASIILLAFPLFFLSALNPLCVSLQKQESFGDKGAGQVFFISTLGSVVGVLFASFILIPALALSKSILVLCLILSVLSFAGIFCYPLKNKKHQRVLFFLTALSAVLFFFLFFISGRQALDSRLGVIDEISSFYGHVKIVDLRAGAEDLRRIYFVNGTAQSIADAPTGKSLTPYNYALVETSLALKSPLKKVLVLGLAGGLIPQLLKEKGVEEVDVVDINPKSVELAEKYFHFQKDQFNIHIEDARTFVRQCTPSYDLVIMDLFEAYSTPDYLLTQEFFQQVKKCLTPQGIFAMNAIGFEDRNASLDTLKVTLKSAWPYLLSVGPATLHEPSNIALFSSGNPLPTNIFLSLEQVPLTIRSLVAESLYHKQLVQDQDLKKTIKPLTDDHNTWSFIFAPSLLILQKDLINGMPSDLLVN